MEFTNKAVADKYESVFGIDKQITIRGMYSGKLSNITPAVAEKLVADGDNQIRLKVKAEAKAPKEKEAPKD